MIKITAMSKDIKINNADYVFDKTDNMMKVLPYLYRKITGDWYIALLEPKLDTIRTLLDTDIIPEYVMLELFVEQGQLDQLMLERPSMAVKKVTTWQKYLDLIASSNLIVEPRAVSEIYRRVGPNIKGLETALEELGNKVNNGEINIKHVRLYIQDNSRVYTSQVVRAFLTNDPRAWDYFYINEMELGTEIAFYATRKYLRKLLKEKNEYLLNRETKDRAVETIDAFSIMRAYSLFETASSYKQLVPLWVIYQSMKIYKEENLSAYL